MRSVRVVIMAVAFALASVAHAETVRPGVSLGVMEYLGTPWTSHYGVYPCLGGYVTIVTDDVSISPGLCVEYSPEFGAWGFFPSVAADFPVSDAFGFDLIVSGWSDQVGDDFTGVAFYAGGGVGVSYFVDGHWTVSASLNAFGGIGDAAVDVVIAPGAGASYTF